MSLGGMAGGLLDGAFDSPGAVAPPNPGNYDPSALNSISSTAHQDASWAQSRTAPTTDWQMSDADRGLSLEARARQAALADELEATLRGERTSLAQQQLRAGEQRVAQNVANQAAGVRGGAGNQLLAAQDATRAQLAGGLEADRLSAELRAREESDARAALAGVLSGMRGQDLGQRGQSQGQAEFGTQTALQQQGLNDAMTRAAWERELQAAQAAAGVTNAGNAASQQGQLAVLGLNAQREQQAQDRKADMVQGAVQGGTGLMQLGLQQQAANKPAAQPTPAPAPTPAQPQATPYGPSSGNPDIIDPWDPTRRKKP